MLSSPVPKLILVMILGEAFGVGFILFLENGLERVQGEGMVMGLQPGVFWGDALTASCPLLLVLHLQDFGSLRSVTSRCDLKTNLVKNGCGGEFESPVSSTRVLRSLPLSSKGSSPVESDVIQMTPQEVTVNLRPGECPWRGPVHEGS